MGIPLRNGGNLMKLHDYEESFLSLSNQQNIFLRSWRAKNPQGVLVLVHGLGEHSGRYAPFAEFLTQHGFSSYAYDQRGHGKTPGPRVFIDRFEDFIQDLSLFIKEVKKNEKKQKIFLLGHSFGGQVVINYLAQHAKQIHGTVLSSPNIQLALELPWIKKTLGQWFSFLFPKLAIPGDISSEYLSHDPQEVLKYDRDPLVQKKITLRLGAQLLANLEKVPFLAKNIKTPCLIFHGDADRITSCAASEEFFSNLGSPDKEIKIYPGLFHETLNELGKEKIFQDVTQWLKKRSKPNGHAKRSS